MKVLVTGSNGFIGKNLISHLQEKQEIEIIKYDRNTPFELIKNNIENIDFIYHLAGVNRPKDINEFRIGNIDLTERIINLIMSKNLKIPFLITSSIQANLDNEYGKSKKKAEDIIINYGKVAPIYIFRLHNVFGKWCRPNYNSVVATFCNNVANNLDIKIDNPSTELTLIYIDDIIKEFLNILYTGKTSYLEGDYCYISPRYNVTLGELANYIKSFKESMKSIMVPNTGNEFVKKLFSTYISYVPMEDLICKAKMNIDERGSFTEIVKTKECGQFSISFSKPGIIRGNHYHHTKIERFIVIKGHAKIKFTNILDNTSYEFEVDDRDIKVITIPVGYTHNIQNIGNDEMILAIWCNEIFNPEFPDTMYKSINNKNIKKIL